MAPVRSLDAATHSLELWHGPTLAFKDMALQMLPHLLYASLKKTGEEKTACILVATSGDTGKAALEGFRDVDHTKIMVFYPKDGVSEIQKLQMVTQEGSNVSVYAVLGNFDDAQTGVKRIFPMRRSVRSCWSGAISSFGQLDQLGPRVAAGGLLCVCLLRPCPGWKAQRRGEGQSLCSHRQFW